MVFACRRYPLFGGNPRPEFGRAKTLLEKALAQEVFAERPNFYTIAQSMLQGPRPRLWRERGCFSSPFATAVLLHFHSSCDGHWVPRSTGVPWGRHGEFRDGCCAGLEREPLAAAEKVRQVEEVLETEGPPDARRCRRALLMRLLGRSQDVAQAKYHRMTWSNLQALAAWWAFWVILWVFSAFLACETFLRCTLGATGFSLSLSPCGRGASCGRYLREAPGPGVRLLHAARALSARGVTEGGASAGCKTDR